MEKKILTVDDIANQWKEFNHSEDRVGEIWKVRYYKKKRSNSRYGELVREEHFLILENPVEHIDQGGKGFRTRILILETGQYDWRNTKNICYVAQHALCTSHNYQTWYRID